MLTTERPPTRLWTCEEYHRAAEFGLFGPEERLELLNGEIITKVSPQGKSHAVAVALIAETLRTIFRQGYYVREEKPLVLSDNSEPEPDLVVMRGSLRDVPDHPTPETAALVVEVSDSTLEFDQNEKATAYARSGIAEYWILNLRARRLEVRRDPGLIDAEIYGYRSLQIVVAPGAVATLEKPEENIPLVDLLPTLPPSSA